MRQFKADTTERERVEKNEDLRLERENASENATTPTRQVSKIHT